TGVEGNKVRNPPAPGGDHGNNWYRRVDTLTVYKIIVLTQDMAVDVRGKIVIPVPGIRAAAENCETFKFLSGPDSARTIGRKNRQVKVSAPGHSPSNLINMGLGTSEVWKEARGHHQDANRPILRKEPWASSR